MNPVEQTRLFNKFVDNKFEHNAKNIIYHMNKLGVYAGWI